MKTLTSNQRYGGLNNRFDKRAKLLHRLGYKYIRIEEFGMAVFVRPLEYEHKRTSIIASDLHHADSDMWIDILKRSLRRW